MLRTALHVGNQLNRKIGVWPEPTRLVVDGTSAHHRDLGRAVELRGLPLGANVADTEPGDFR